MSPSSSTNRERGSGTTKRASPTLLKPERGFEYLGELDVEKDRLLGVGDLDSVLLVKIGDVDVVDSFHDLLHFADLRAQTFKNPNPNVHFLSPFLSFPGDEAHRFVGV